MKLALHNLSKAVLATANQCGIVDAYGYLRRKITKSQVAIFLYHQVSPEKLYWSDSQPVSPQNFEGQIESLGKSCEFLSLDKLAEYIQNVKTLPEKAAIITLDDGYMNNYLYAYPILKKHHIPATIFLATDYINNGKLFWFDQVKYIIHHTTTSELNLGDFGSYPLSTSSDRLHLSHNIVQILKTLPDKKKNLVIEKLLSVSNVDIPPDLGRSLTLSWSEVREMGNNGIAFGAHTVSHPILTMLPPEQAKWEIIQSKKDIEKHLQQRVTAFAYPNGLLKDFNSHIANLVKESGFACAVTAIPLLITHKANPYKLGRVMCQNPNTDKLVLSGLYADLKLHRLQSIY